MRGPRIPALAVGALLVVSVGLTAGPVAAQNTTIVLACNSSAGYVNGTVTFYPSLFDQSQTFSTPASCGPDSISGLKTDRQGKVGVPFVTTAARFDYTQASANGNGGGTILGTLPIRNEPITDNAAATIAKLTIRG
jgi:hypothetical protein